MPIRIIAQPFTSCRPETEPTAETVTIIEPDANGDFSHKLLGSITLREVKEVEDGVIVSVRFRASGKYDAWRAGDPTSSLYLQALRQIVFSAHGNRLNLPPKFPQRVTLANVFLRTGGPALDLSIMKKTDGSSDPWQKLSDIQLSYTP